MKADTRVVLILAFLSVFFVVGLPYWQISYSEVSLPSSLYGWGLVVAFVSAVILRMTFRASLVQTLGTVGLAVPAMVLARVVTETFQDPTSHNLWPVELVIAAGVGLSVALAGALLGGVAAFALERMGR